MKRLIFLLLYISSSSKTQNKNATTYLNVTFLPMFLKKAINTKTNSQGKVIFSFLEDYKIMLHAFSKSNKTKPGWDLI